MTTCQVLLEAATTGQRFAFAAAALHFGGVDFYGVLRPYAGPEAFEAATERLWERFPSASLPVMLRVAQQEFGPQEFGIEHVLAEGKKRIADTIYGGLVDRFSEEYRRLYEDNQRIIEMLQESGFELPGELRAAAEFALGHRFEEVVRREHKRPEAGNYDEAIAIADDVTRRGYRIDRTASRDLFQCLIEQVASEALAEPSDAAVDDVEAVLALASRLGIGLNLDVPQEQVYAALQATSNPGPSLMRMAGLLHLAPSLLYSHRNTPMVGSPARF